MLGGGSVIGPVVAQTRAGSPERIGALLEQGQAAYRSKNLEAMTSAYEQVLLEDEDNVQALNNLAYSLVDQFNQPQQALKYAQRAQRLAGENASVLDTVGWVYARAGKTAEGENALRDALRLDPNSLPPRFHLAKVYALAGRKSEARQEFEECVNRARRVENAEYQRLAQEELQKLP